MMPLGESVFLSDATSLPSFGWTVLILSRELLKYELLLPVGFADIYIKLDGIFSHGQFSAQRLFVIVRWAQRVGYQKTLDASIFLIPKKQQLPSPIATTTSQRSILPIYECDFVTAFFMVPRNVPSRLDKELELENELQVSDDLDYWYRCRYLLCDDANELCQLALESCVNPGDACLW